MERLEHASEVLQAFSDYAERIERESHSAYVPSLRLYCDGSGRIHDDIAHIVYLEFTDLKDLLDKLHQS